jgi:riboflavin kinase/FMN adenylyltransferase
MSERLPFTIGGRTVRGKRLGTELGFPTANLAYPAGAALPENGVYVASALVDGKRYVAILNQGMHPTAPAAVRPSKPTCWATKAASCTAGN